MPGKVMIVEDDETMLGILKYNLSKDGYTVITSMEGLQALQLARSEKPDLILLDIMLPKMNGLEVCRILRKEMSVPIIMLTAKTEEIDKIVGLEIGADDYITKPFSMRELLARVHASFRRANLIENEATKSQKESSRTIKVGPIEVDTSRHVVTINNKVIDFSPKEFDLMTYLIQNHGQVFNREALLEKVWGYDFAGDTRTVDVHIRWLREKIEDDPASPQYIVTIRGFGYKLDI